MKINQVEELVGITKKNIRFYEEQGLISPERDPENGYRNYNLKEVDELMKIKLLRKMSVPIEAIRQLKNGQISFKTCMENQIVRLNHEQHNIELMKSLCENISEEVSDLSNLDATVYLSEMKKMEEGGTIFMNIEDRDIRKKKYGPVIAATLVITLLIAIIGLVVWINSFDPIPTPVLIIFIVPNCLAIIGIIVALTQRFKEIDGGEEYEARKY